MPTTAETRRRRLQAHTPPLLSWLAGRRGGLSRDHAGETRKTAPRPFGCGRRRPRLSLNLVLLLVLRALVVRQRPAGHTPLQRSTARPAYWSFGMLEVDRPGVILAEFCAAPGGSESGF